MDIAAVCMNTKYVEESDDARKYEYALKWKIHDTLSRLGSSENTFTQVYVYDLKETHHYDIIIRFGIEPGLNKTIIPTVSNNFMLV